VGTEVFFRKIGDGLFQVDGDLDAAKVATVKLDQVIKCVFTRPRNYKFFKKWWKMIEFAYDHWEPGELQIPRWKHVKPQRDLNAFRKDVTIMAGHYDAFYRIDGSVRIEAKSISFGKMTEEDFENFYSRCVNVILQRILTNYTREDLDRVVEQLLLGFAR
jgi:hypothetical protein